MNCYYYVDELFIFTYCPLTHPVLLPYLILYHPSCVDIIVTVFPFFNYPTTLYDVDGPLLILSAETVTSPNFSAACTLIAP